MEDRGWPAYVVEFVGTFILVFAICIAVVANGKGGIGFTDWVTIGLVHAFALAALVAAFGGTSGGHFNPAVTTTMLALRKITPIDGLIYILVQLAGATAAALVLKITLNGGEGVVINPADAANYGAPSFEGNRLIDGALPAFILEGIGVFILLTAIMGTAVNVRANQAWTPLIIGLTLGLANLMIAPMTGGALNPARAFGPALVGGAFDGFGSWLFVYAIGPIVGGLLAGIFYMGAVLRPQEAEFGGRLVDTDVPPARAEGAIESALEGPGERPEDKLS
ncbi:MAG: aquaporin [Solirubrobacteraceae bacterium]|nr:aquaporin [Solirubrobacteraceae bacterium]